jgi:hypothetical protein
MMTLLATSGKNKACPDDAARQRVDGQETPTHVF